MVSFISSLICGPLELDHWPRGTQLSLSLPKSLFYRTTSNRMGLFTTECPAVTLWFPVGEILCGPPLLPVQLYFCKYAYFISAFVITLVYIEEKLTGLLSIMFRPVFNTYTSTACKKPLWKNLLSNIKLKLWGALDVLEPYVLKYSVLGWYYSP